MTNKECSGTWKWACERMKEGCIVRPADATGPVKYKLDSGNNRLIMWTFKDKPTKTDWESANIFLSDFENVDWVTFSDTSSDVFSDTDNQTNVADFDKLKAEQTEDIEYLKRALKDTDAIWKRHREELDRLTEDIETLHQQRILADREAEKLKEELALLEYQVIGLNRTVDTLKGAMSDITEWLTAVHGTATSAHALGSAIKKRGF